MQPKSYRVKVVVEGELCAGRDVPESKEPHPGLPMHSPLLGDTVGLAAVVHEPSIVPLLSSVQHDATVDGQEVVILVLSFLHFYHPPTGRIQIKKLSIYLSWCI